VLRGLGGGGLSPFCRGGGEAGEDGAVEHGVEALVELFGVVDEEGDWELDDGSSRLCELFAGFGAIACCAGLTGLCSVVGMSGVVSSDVGVGGATFEGPG